MLASSKNAGINKTKYKDK